MIGGLEQLVSILVFVELALDADPPYELAFMGKVSILVFVELALDGKRPTITIVSDLSFNPCFRGTCS